MKVRELIKKLQKCDAELEVYLSVTDEEQYVTSHFDIATIEHWQKEQTTITSTSTQEIS